MLQALYEKKVGQKLLLVCFLVLFLLALLFGSLNAANRSGSWDNAVTLLNDGWTLTAGDGTAHAVSLPTYCAGGDHSVKLDCLMPSGDRLTDPVIRIFSDYERLQVTLDGQTIYEYTGTNATEWSMTGATGRTVHMIPLPSDYAGKPLSIRYEFELTNGGRFGLSAPQLASKAALFSRDMIDELPYVMMAAIAAIAGIAMIVVRLTMKEQEAFCNTVWYVGLFSVMFAAFTLYQTVYADALLPNGTVLHMMVYSTALLMPIPVAGLFTDYFGTRARRLCIAAIALCFVSFFVQMGLYVAGAVDFRTLLPVTFAVIVLAGAAIIAAMLLDRRDGQSDVGRMFYTSVPPVVGAVADLALMLWGVPMSRHMLFFTIGVAVFILLQSIWFVRSYLRMVRAAAESKVLREMAFKDTLTGVGNRNAYERYIQALSTRDSREQLYCAVADINDLKRINDTYGHQMGDHVILQVGRMLTETFGASGSIFRTGGDEFVALICDTDREVLIRMKQDFRQALAQYNRLHNPTIRVAIGTGEIAPEDHDSVTAFIRRVDSLMYEDKKLSKEEELLDEIAERVPAEKSEPAP